ncbi:MAG: hypothetical protein WC565_07585 [Parcubacteria group bacterium]
MNRNPSSIPAVPDAPGVTTVQDNAWSVFTVVVSTAAFGAVVGLVSGVLAELDLRGILSRAVIGIVIPFALGMAGGLAILAIVFWQRIVAALADRATPPAIAMQAIQQERIRLLPVRGGARDPQMVLSGSDAAGYTPDDLRALVHQAYTVGHSVRKLLGTQLPSGRRIESPEDLTAFYELLTAAGFIIGRSARSAGQLVGTEDECAAALLNAPV